LEERFQGLIFLMEVAVGCSFQPSSDKLNQKPGRPSAPELVVSHVGEAEASREFLLSEILVRQMRERSAKSQDLRQPVVRFIEHDRDPLPLLDSVLRSTLRDGNLRLEYYRFGASTGSAFDQSRIGVRFHREMVNEPTGLARREGRMSNQEARSLEPGCCAHP
jgi:hypothetical protein